MNIRICYSGKKVLVTGACGFIGSHLCRRLLALGGDVYGLDIVERHSNLDNIHWRQSDMAEASATFDTIRSIKPDIIFHLGSYVTGSRDSEFVFPTFRSNLVSTVNLLMAVKETGCQRVVLAGSMEEPQSGQNNLTSISPYAVSKWASSSYGRMFHSLYGLPVIILHLYMVYGPGQFDTKKLIPYVILSLLRNESPKLMSGKRKVDWIYIDDIVEGLIISAQAENVLGQTIDIGSGSFATVKNVAEQIVGIINPNVKPDYGALEDRPFESTRVADVQRTFQLTGWKGHVGLVDGLGRTVNWFREQLANGKFC